jgi:predicted metal-dependent hydrolase
MKKILKRKINVEGIEINLTQKRIKNLRLRICPPLGEVRISVPLRVGLKSIKKIIISKISWIKEAQIKILNRKKIQELKFISDEKHNFFGEEFLLEIIENSDSTKVFLSGEKIKIHSKKNFTLQQKRKILDEFYRAELKKIIPRFIQKYEQKMRVKVEEFGVKKMKTRWGTCNARARRIWLNLELAKKPIQCLEFIITHEMVHLLERNHSKKFYELMDKFMSDWKIWKEKLNK